MICCLWVLFAMMAGCAPMNPAPPEAEDTRHTPAASSDYKASPPSANYHFLESRLHIKKNQLKKAVTSLKKALVLDNNSFFLTHDLVRLYLKLNQKNQADEIAEQFIQRNPDHVDGLLLFVQLNQDILDDQTLLDMLNRILQLDPDNKETFLRLGKIYMDKENYSQGLSLFEKMNRQFPDYYVSWFYLGEVRLALKQYKAAEESFLKSIELEPQLIQPRFRLITIYQSLASEQSHEKILDAYQGILDIEPNNYRAKLGLGLHYYKAGKTQKAEDHFRDLGKSANIDNGSRLMMVAVDEFITAKRYEDAVIVFSQMLKGNEGNPTLTFFSAMAYEAVEDFKQAIALYLKVAPDHSQYKKSILSAAFLYKETGEIGNAIKYLEKKHLEIPEDIDILIYLASLYERETQYEKAIPLLKKGLDGSPDNTSLLFRLGVIQDKSGRKDECLETIKKVIELDPKDANALNYLGYSYADMGVLLDEALELTLRAHKLKPNDGYITDSLGWVYYKLGQFEKAVELLEKAARLSSFESIISDHLGDAYRKTGQWTKALETYRKALSNADKEDQELITTIKEKIDAVQKKIEE